MTTTNVHTAWQYTACLYIPFADGPDLQGFTGTSQTVGGTVLCDVETADELVAILKANAAKKGHTLMINNRDIVRCIKPMRVTKARELVG